MYNGMPPLVEATSSTDPWQMAPLAPAGASPWHGGGGGEVTPGGFGGGAPQQPRHMPGTPYAAQQFAPTPAVVARDNPWLAAPLAQPGYDPFSMPASAFDRQEGQGGTPGFTPWAAGPVQTIPSPSRQEPAWFTPRAREGNLENGFGGFGENEEWPPAGNGWLQEQGPMFSPAPGVSPSPSTSSALPVGPRAQYKRPDEWRSDFSMPRPGTLQRLLSIGKGSGDSFRALLGKPTLHWTLDAAKGACQWDVRRPPDAFRISSKHRPLDFLEFQEGALNPPPLRMRVTHPLLPWPILVSAGPSEVVTVGHLLHTIHAELSRQVYHRDFWNDAMREEDRKYIHEAWAERSGGNRAVAEQGIRRMDFLGERWLFTGLRRVGDGEWQMKLKSGRRGR